MIQAKDELILGIDLNPNYAQVTYWHQSVREPETLGVRDGTQQLPPGIAQTEKYPAIDHIFEKIESGEAIEQNGILYEPAGILAAYLRQCISSLKLLTDHTVMHVMVTVQRLDENLNQVIVDALLRLGVDRKRIYVQDYLSSFYFYTVNQKKELWMQDVALLTYEPDKEKHPVRTDCPEDSLTGEAGSLEGKPAAEETQPCESGQIVGYVLHIDHSTKPAIAVADLIARQPMNEEVRAGRKEEDWRKEKDRLFFELLKKVFERRTVSVSYLMGDYFNKSWTKRSIQFLCTGRRAYQGMNLYSKGACYAGMERAGLIPPRDIIYGGMDMVDRNIGMEMRIRGRDNYYPLVNAGVNWYEVHHVCEFIPHGEREIRLISRPMISPETSSHKNPSDITSGDPTIHSMRLPGLPRRPDRATRLRMTVYFSSSSCCHVEVEDLGFGGLYKSSGLSWSRDIRF
ncbi:MAG: DUF5716 family protein [Clostridiales bacterium]|nr:DUF5716 family protein [Clostridiales bacterium]